MELRLVATFERMYGALMATSADVTSARIGARLRREREERGWSQQEVATRLRDRGIDLHVSAIAKIEAGTRALRVNEALAISAMLDKPLEELYAPPGDEWEDVIAMLESALASYRNGQALAHEALAKADDLGRDFGSEGRSMGRHPVIAGRVADLIERLNWFHRDGEPEGAKADNG